MGHLFKIGEHKLFFGNCLEIMKELEPVDAIICDPPYEKSMHDNFGSLEKSRNDGQGRKRTSLDFECIDGIREETAQNMARLARGWVLAFCTSEGVAAWRDAIEAAGMRYKRACPWVKPDAAPQFNGQGPALAHEMMVTAWAGKGHSKWNGGGRRGVFTHNTNQPDREGTHPTEKPLPLMMELVHLFTNPGDTVLDPFMGSGTTGLACAKLGRKFIGVERDEKYFDLAMRRISAAPGAGKTFDGAPPIFELT